MTSSKNAYPFSGRALPIQVLAAFLLAITFVYAENEEQPFREPCIQRIRIEESESFAINYSDPRARGGRSLVNVDRSSLPDQETSTFFTFGRNDGIDARTGEVFPPRMNGDHAAIPYRWTLSGRKLFATWHLKYGLEVLQAELDSYEAEPREQREAFQRGLEGVQGVTERTMIRSGAPSGLRRRIWLMPIHSYQTGIYGWEVGDELLKTGQPIGPPPEVFHYDIRALDEVQLELYVTADGKLQRWLYDGQTWRLTMDYKFKLDGPFLVFHDGKSIVTQREKDWCVLSALDDQTPGVRRLMQKIDDTPLTLVEDVFAGKQYFEYRGKLYDESGGERLEIPPVANPPEKIKAISDFVWSHRMP